MTNRIKVCITLIIILINQSNLFAIQNQTKEKLIILFPEEYLKIDRELCEITYNLIEKNFKPESFRVVNKRFFITLNSEVTGFPSCDFIKSDSVLISKWWNEIEFNQDESFVSFLWQRDVNGCTTILNFGAYKSFIDSLRKESYDKKRELAVNLFSISKDFIVKNKESFIYEYLKNNNQTLKLKNKKDSIYNIQINNYKSFTKSYFLQKKNNEYKLVYQKGFPKESIANLLTVEDWFVDDTIQVNLRHKLYGNDEVNYTINLNKFKKYFIETSDTFIGNIESDNDNYKTIMLLIDNDNRSAHLLKFVIPKSQLFTSTKIYFNATLYSNIRLDNLSDIDKEYKDKNKKMKLEL